MDTIGFSWQLRIQEPDKETWVEEIGDGSIDDLRESDEKIDLLSEGFISQESEEQDRDINTVSITISGDYVAVYKILRKLLHVRR